jgi:hypothetical protein
LVFGPLLAVAPVLDVLAGGSAGLMHFVAATAGTALLAASLVGGIDRRRDTSGTIRAKIGERLAPEP